MHARRSHLSPVLAACLATAAGLGCAGPRRAAPPPAPNAVMTPRASVSPGEPVRWELPDAARFGERVRCIDRELDRLQLNAYAEPRDTVYPEGHPLEVNTVADRVAFVVHRRPDIGAACTRAPGEPAF